MACVGADTSSFYCAIASRLADFLCQEIERGVSANGKIVFTLYAETIEDWSPFTWAPARILCMCLDVIKVFVDALQKTYCISALVLNEQDGVFDVEFCLFLR